MRETTLCYIKNGTHVLMLKRNKKQNDPNHDKWIGIGGGIEQGETPEECLLREVLEETGLTLSSYTKRGILYFHSDLWDDEIMHLFTSDSFTGTLTPCDEGELHWIELEKILDLPLWEGDRVFLKLLNDNAPYFTMHLYYEGEKLTHTVLNNAINPLQTFHNRL